MGGKICEHYVMLAYEVLRTVQGLPENILESGFSVVFVFNFCMIRNFLRIAAMHYHIMKRSRLQASLTFIKDV